MTMEHKAFSFDWTAFDSELRAVLEHSLAHGDTRGLLEFCLKNLSDLSDPYEGLPLVPEAPVDLHSEDVQTIADFALTKFYRPSRDIGLAADWMELSDVLPGPAQCALLGQPIGQIAHFDPGRMGSYFQPPAVVRTSVSILQPHQEHQALAHFIDALLHVQDAGRGLYVTF